MRWASSPAALRVNVNPSTWSGRTCWFATSHMTRSAISSVLPEPAPATTSSGSSGGAAMPPSRGGLPLAAERPVFGAAGHAALREPAGLHRDLVRGELRVLQRLVGRRRRLAGLEVDDDQVAVGVHLQPVDPAAQLDVR